MLQVEEVRPMADRLQLRGHRAHDRHDDPGLQLVVDRSQRVETCHGMCSRPNAARQTRLLSYVTVPHPMPIIVGVPRSGTTLLRMMLDAHSELAVPPETGFLPALADLEPDSDAATSAWAIITGFHTWPDFRLDADALRTALEREPWQPSGLRRELSIAYMRNALARRGGATRRRPTEASSIGSRRCCRRPATSTSSGMDET